MSFWKIAWRNIQQRGLASSLTALSIALGVAVMIAVIVIHAVAVQQFERTAQGYHLIVGGKEGALQLVLSTVYHIGQPLYPIPYTYYQKFTGDGEFASATKTAIPVCLGDSYEAPNGSMFRVVGTTPDLFDKIEYDREADGTPVKYAFQPGGRNFKSENYFEAVVGSVVAAQSGLKVGDEVNPTHGLGGDGHKHDGFKVVGILEPTGNANDRAVFINIEGFYLLEGHALAPDDAHENEAEHEHAAEEHAHEGEPGHAEEPAHEGEDADAHQHEDEAGHDHETESAGHAAEHAHESEPAGHADHEADAHDHAPEGEHAHDEDSHAHEGEEPHEHGEEHAHEHGEEHAHAHEGEHAHAHDEHGHDHEHEHAHAHTPLPIEQREVTAILVECKDNFGAMGLDIAINKGEDRVAQAVAPVREVAVLMNSIVGPVRLVLLVLTILILIVAGISILVSIYNSMSERSHDIAVMRALGASRGAVMAIILVESILLSLLGGLLGILLGHGLIGLVSPYVVERTGVSLGLFQFDWRELVLIPGLILLASLVGLLPALAAYRTDVAKSLAGSR